MNKVKSIIIKFLESNFYKNLKDAIKRLQSNKYKQEFEEYKDVKKILYLLSPEHGNLGDQAIAYASLKFIRENFPEYKIIELERDEINKYYKPIKSVLNKEDLIILHGGGNLGNLYIQEEMVRRFIIKNFKDNKIICMTQTISFSDDKKGEKELNITKGIYNAHNDLTILAREDKSYETMKKIFTCKIIKVPDIVFYLEDMFQENIKDRKGIMTCLREDKESIWAEKKEDFIIDLKSKNEDVFCYDTVVDLVIRDNNREKELYDIWNKYRRHKLVITDRLHGMIFAYITKTPCIVLKSLDHKVVESYKWIQGVNFIKLVDDLSYSKIEPILKEMIDINNIQTKSIKETYFVNLEKKMN